MKGYFKIHILLFFIFYCHLAVGTETAFSSVTEPSPIVERSFDQGKLDKLKNDSQFKYKQSTEQRQSFWDKLLTAIREYFMWIMSRLFNNMPNVSQWVFFSIIAVVAVFIIVKLLDINLKNAFLDKGDSGNINYKVEEENIHDLDFNKLIEESIRQSEFRNAIRYLYLFSLKKLSDKHLIEWIPGKTNHEYEMELQQKPVAAHFSKLGYYFEYAWYGEFEINSESFQKAQHVFKGLDDTLVK
jgi:hypothetical protein